MAAEDSAKKEGQGDSTREGIGWSALREQIRRASGGLAPGQPGHVGPAAEPSGVRTRPEAQQRWSTPAPRVFGKSVPPAAMTKSSASPVPRAPAPLGASLPPPPARGPGSMPSPPAVTTVSARSATEQDVAIADVATGDVAERPSQAGETPQVSRSRLETPRERKITVPERRGSRSLQATGERGSLPSLKDVRASSQGRYSFRNLPPEVFATERPAAASQVARPADTMRDRAETPPNRVIPRTARRGRDEGDNTPVRSRAAERRRSSRPPPQAAKMPQVQGGGAVLPSVVVDPSLTAEALEWVQAAAAPTDERTLPSVVVEPSLRHAGEHLGEANHAARTTPAAQPLRSPSRHAPEGQEVALGNGSGALQQASWDRRRGVAVKAALALGLLLLAGAALVRLG